ncbi:MAG TPA: amidohydrolase family protein [Thermoanaerobaculia bacterium]|nr:amidohydrolase family protein [Thermoanaerobaculia bacterium]
MRTFDVHLHVQPWEMIRPAVLALIDDQGHRDARSILSSPETLLRWMDQEEIDRACCINYVSPDVMGFTAEANDWIASFTKDHRERLLPVGSVHPKTTPDLLSETRRILDLGIRMIKIHPPHQLFAANAYRSDLPALAEVYGLCEQRRIPVMFHTGTSIFPGARNVFADPMPIDDVAVDFPSLPIVLAHAGRPLYGNTAFFLVRRHRNISIDLSGIPPQRLGEHVPRLDEIATRALWGTDWPSPGVTSPKANRDAFLALGFADEINRRVLGANAASLFDRMA